MQFFLLLLVALCIFAIPALAEAVGFYLWRRRLNRVRLTFNPTNR